MKWARHLTRTGRGEVRREFWWGNTREKDRLVYLEVDGKILLKLIFKKGYEEHENWCCMVQSRNRL